ncbi:hypothetical protein ACJJTC_011247 [Scirpophaga incertulas]
MYLHRPPQVALCGHATRRVTHLCTYTDHHHQRSVGTRYGGSHTYVPTPTTTGSALWARDTAGHTPMYLHRPPQRSVGTRHGGSHIYVPTPTTTTSALWARDTAGHTPMYLHRPPQVALCGHATRRVTHLCTYTDHHHQRSVGTRHGGSHTYVPTPTTTGSALWARDTAGHTSMYLHRPPPPALCGHATRRVTHLCTYTDHHSALWARDTAGHTPMYLHRPPQVALCGHATRRVTHLCTYTDHHHQRSVGTRHGGSHTYVPTPTTTGSALWARDTAGHTPMYLHRPPPPALCGHATRRVTHLCTYTDHHHQRSVGTRHGGSHTYVPTPTTTGSALWARDTAGHTSMYLHRPPPPALCGHATRRVTHLCTYTDHHHQRSVGTRHGGSHTYVPTPTTTGSALWARDTAGHTSMYLHRPPPPALCGHATRRVTHLCTYTDHHSALWARDTAGHTPMYLHRPPQVALCRHATRRVTHLCTYTDHHHQRLWARDTAGHTPMYLHRPPQVALCGHATRRVTHLCTYTDHHHQRSVGTRHGGSHTYVPTPTTTGSALWARDTAGHTPMYLHRPPPPALCGHATRRVTHLCTYTDHHHQRSVGTRHGGSHTYVPTPTTTGSALWARDTAGHTPMYLHRPPQVALCGHATQRVTHLCTYTDHHR